MIGDILVQHAWLWPLAWQSTAALAMGLGGSLVLRRRAVRAHQLLLLALVAAIAAPVLSQVVKQHQWGMLESRPVVVEVRPPAFVALDAPATVESTQDREIDQASVSEATLPVLPATATATAQPIEWTRLVLAVWTLFSAALLIRLVVRLLLGFRLAQRSEPCNVDEIARAIESAKTKLGFRTDVLLRKSAETRSPVIWCWGVRPILLVPHGAGEGKGIDWTGIVCHELAHWKRRDHLSGLWTELVLCVLPWNPLAWLAQRRLKQLSEQACDDWVIAAGQTGTRYARTLLNLSVQPQSALALSVVTSKRTLAGRIRRIVEDQCSSPHSGRRWSLATATAAACLAVTIAFAQTRSEAVAPPTWASAGIASPAVELPKEVERIIRANTRTLSKLKSARATLEIERRDVAKDKGTLLWRESCSEWFDGHKARVDTRVTPDPEGPRQILIHSTEEGSSYIATPSDNHRVIITRGNRIVTTQLQRDSDRDGHMAWITAGDDPNRTGRGDGPTLLRYVRFGEWIDTLEQHTRFLAARGDLPTVSESRLNGEPCLLLEWHLESHADGSIYRIWVLPAKGHSIAKFQWFVRDDRLLREQVMEIEDYGNGVFWYRRAEARRWLYDRTLADHTVAKLTEFHPNVPVDPKRFTLAGMGIPDGTGIQDNIAVRTKYIYRVSAESGEAYLELSPWQSILPARAEDRYRKRDHLSDLGVFLLETALTEPGVGETAGIRMNSLLDPSQIFLRLVDDDRLPVVGAKVSTSVAFREDMLGGTLEWIDEQTSSEGGSVRFQTKDVLPAGRKTRGLYILHEERGLGAVWELAPADAGKSFTIRLAPVCRVRGNVGSPDLESVNMPLRWATANVRWSDNVVIGADPRKKPYPFDFPLPPGEYVLEFGGSGGKNGIPAPITASLRDKRLTVTIPKDQSELDLGTVELEPTGLTKLIGKAAPQLGPIKSWKNGGPVTLAQLRGQAVLLHFGGQSPSVPRDLPRLVKLHKALGDKGLTIIAIYNCDSMAELERRWTDTYQRLGGVTDVPFRIAIDGGEPTFYEGSGRERPGATCGRYDITRWSTNVLIGPAGNVLGSLNLNAAREMISAMLGVPPEEPEALPTPAWRQGFDRVYCLEDGEILRRIIPPFIPQRKDYYINEASEPESRKTEPPHQFRFHWDGGLQLRGMSFINSTSRIHRLLEDVVGLQDHEYEGPKELLNLERPGDWIVRSDAPREAKLRVMEALLTEEMGRTIRFKKRPAEHAVVIATGQFKFHAVFDDENVRIFAGEAQPTREEEAGRFMDGARSVGEFLERLGPMLGVTMIDQTDRQQETIIPFQVYLRKPLVRTIRDMAEKRRRLEALLANVTAQTELQFEIQTQPAEVWLVTEEESK